MEQLEALKITLEISRKDAQDKLEQVRIQTFLMKEEKRKSEHADTDSETKEAKKRRLLKELQDLDEDQDVVVIVESLAKKEKEASLAISMNQQKLRCFQDLMKSTGTTSRSSFETKAGFIKSLMLALQLVGDDHIAPSLVFPLVNLFEECSQDRGTFSMLVQNSKLGATWDQVSQFMMEQGGKHTASQRRSQFDRFTVGAGLLFSQVIVEFNRAAEACGQNVRQDSELMSQTLLAAMRDQPQLVSTEKLLELSNVLEAYSKIPSKERMEKKMKDIYTDIAERLTAIVGTKVVGKKTAVQPQQAQEQVAWTAVGSTRKPFQSANNVKRYPGQSYSSAAARGDSTARIYPTGLGRGSSGNDIPVDCVRGFCIDFYRAKANCRRQESCRYSHIPCASWVNRGICEYKGKSCPGAHPDHLKP